MNQPNDPVDPERRAELKRQAVYLIYKKPVVELLNTLRSTCSSALRALFNDDHRDNPPRPPLCLP